MQGHQCSFVAVLVMHVMDDVQRSNVLFSQPIHKVIHAFHDFVIVQHFIHHWRFFRANLDLHFFINAAVNCIQHGFRQVGTRAEELHLFTDNHRANTTCDGIVIVVEVRTHQVIVFILYR
ncbi:Uncharacterised protein [Yersinia enterocolitica]|nr:Uncharacterised protein [Yersinia enterocolitica]